MNTTSTRVLAIAALATLWAGCMDETATRTERLEAVQSGSIERLHTYQRILLASQPAPEDFERAKTSNVRTIINLRGAGENPDFDERSLVTALGMRYENPGFRGAEELTDDLLDETRELLRTAERPIMMHCASANRVGAIWAVYRSLDEGLAWERALEEGKIVGLRSAALEQRAREYVDRHRGRPEATGSPSSTPGPETPGPETATLFCRHAFSAGSYIGVYSFRHGELPIPPPDPDQVDLTYYFDDDDCSQGVIIGHDDRPGSLFPIGHEPWRELLRRRPPGGHADSVVAIVPLTRDREGSAFWVRSETGETVLVRLSAVEQAAYSDLVSGVTPGVEFEWFRPPPPPDRSVAPD